MFKRSFLFVVLIALLVCVLMIASTSLAQDVAESTATLVASEPLETPATEATFILDQPADDPIVDVPEETQPIFSPPAPVDVANGLILALFTLFASAIASPLTSPLVSLVKRIPFFSKIDPVTQQPRLNGSQVNLMVAAGLSIISWTAASLGFAGQLETVYALIFAVLPVLTGAGGNFVANKAVYEYSKRKSIPIAGYARTLGSIQRHGIPTPDGLFDPYEAANHFQDGRVR